MYFKFLLLLQTGIVKRDRTVLSTRISSTQETRYIVFCFNMENFWKSRNLVNKL